MVLTPMKYLNNMDINMMDNDKTKTVMLELTYDSNGEKISGIAIRKHWRSDKGVGCILNDIEDFIPKLPIWRPSIKEVKI